MTTQEKHEYYLTFRRFQQGREKAFGPSINKALNKQIQQAIQAVKANSYNPQLKISSQQIHSTLRPLYLDSIIYGAKVRAFLNSQKARMPIGFNERMIQLMLQYFETDIMNTSEGITNTTRELVQRVLGNAALYGYGIDWQVNELEKLTALNYTRSRMIARTETVTAANQAGRFAAKETGLVLFKEWLSTRDNRTRGNPINGQKDIANHWIMYGVTTGIDDYFTVENGVTMLQPGAKKQENGLPVPKRDVINCRCTTLYLPQRNSAGRLITV